MRSPNRRMYLLGVLVLLVVSTGFAQMGTIHSKHVPHVRVPQGQVFKAPTTATYQFADFVAGGCGLRNANQCQLKLSGSCSVNIPCGTAPSTPLDAIIYWTVLGPVNSHDSSVTVTRVFPTPSASVTLKGDPIAVGGDPCWGSDGAHMYRAHVPVSVVSGNGDYKVSFNAAASGLTTNEDPWDGNTVFPLMEGAAIVSIDKGARFVTVFDDVSGLLLFPPSSPLNYVLQLITPTIAGDDLKFNTIAADGQVGTSVAADQDATTETTSLFNFFPFPLQLAGPGSSNAQTDNDSDFNGNSARPLPLLWDVSTHEFTDPLGGSSQLTVQYTTAADCSNIVANVFSQLQHF